MSVYPFAIGQLYWAIPDAPLERTIQPARFAGFGSLGTPQWIWLGVAEADCLNDGGDFGALWVGDAITPPSVEIAGLLSVK